MAKEESSSNSLGTVNSIPPVAWQETDRDPQESWLEACSGGADPSSLDSTSAVTACSPVRE